MSAHFSTPLLQLPDPLPIPALPVGGGRAPFLLRLRPPGSKSLTNRALLLAGLASGTSVLERPLLDADDAERMLAALETLGAAPSRRGNDVEVRGVGGRWRAGPKGVRLDLNNAGTATRFLAASAMLADGPVTIDGNARMRERPIGPLVEALGLLGVKARYEGTRGCPPVCLHPPATLPAAATVNIPPAMSSQFASALLLVGPWLPGGLTIKQTGRMVSGSYVGMTAGLLDQLGAAVRTSEDLRVVRVGPSSDPEAGRPADDRRGLAAFRYAVEPDASAATTFWAAATMFAGAVCRVEGIDACSLQGDSRFPDVLARAGATIITDDGPPAGLGCRGGRTIAPVMADMVDMPDAVMALAVVAAFATGRSVVRGVGTLRVKETDRIAALQKELAKIGVRVEPDVLGDPETIAVEPPAKGIDCSPGCPRVEFDTYDDHRMAMSLALIGLRRPNTFIRTPRCVAKTYPGFWSDFGRLYG